MARTACADLPAFPLQVLLRRHSDWREFPAAVVDHDRPQGICLWVNERARAGRILPGMRYAAALALSRELRAGVVSPEEIAAEIEAVMKKLRFFSPEAEAARDDPGIFWLGAEGLGLLYPSFLRWAALIRADLVRAGYDARVAVGFSRFGSYAAARSVEGGGAEDPRGTVVFRDAAEERAAVRRIPMDRIACAPAFRDTLARLGIFELGGFLDLPPAGVRRRFGEEAHLLHRRARGDLWAPLEPEIPEEAHERRLILDTPEKDTARLLAAIEEELRVLLERLSARGRALSSLTLEVAFDRPAPDGTRRRAESLRPARPTLDLDLLRDLLRLRLESMRFPSGVVEVRCEVEWCAAGAEQMALFADRSPRDLAAANRALARVRAEFGESSVSTVRLREAHLPEARFACEPMTRLAEARPRKVLAVPLVRRILLRPEAVSLRGAHPGERMPAGGRAAPSRGAVAEARAGMTIVGAGIIREAIGPYAVSGGWWRRPVERHYWYVRVEAARPDGPGGGCAGAGEVSAGETGAREANARGTSAGENTTWFWIYRDALRQRWFRQGELE